MSGSIRLLATLAVLVLVASACASVSAPEPTAVPDPPDKILFIGSSLTSWQGSVYLHLKLLAKSANPPSVIQTDSVIQGGATLETMWESTTAREVIREGDYDVVILQGNIPRTDVDTFHEYARKFDAEIREAGAEPVFFMAWSFEVEWFAWITMEEIAQAHRDIAMELDADVAPVGLAWQRATEERPELDMYDRDGVHPSIHGTYLAVNVVYATIFGESPVGLAYLPVMGGVTEEEAVFLQRIAWETVQEFQAQQ